MSRLWPILAVVLLGAEVGTAQSIRGTVTSAEDGRPVAGASILLQGTTRGTMTDSLGRYVLRHVVPGVHVVAARSVAYRAGAERVTVSKRDTLRVDFVLEPDVVALAPVDVFADVFRWDDPEPSVRSLTPRQVRRLPGAGEDVLRSLQAIPGVVAPNDFSARLAVRGGGPDQNLIVLDGVEAFNPYRLYGVVSMFNPAVLSDVTLHTGGFSARYGDRLSSVLDVQSRAGTSQQQLAGAVNASVVSSNFVVEGRTGFWDGGWLVTGRRTYYDLLLDLVAHRLDAIQETRRLPHFADVQGSLEVHPAPGHRLRVGAILSRDALDVAFDGNIPQGSAADRLVADDVTRNDVAYATWAWTPQPHVQTKLTASWYRTAGDLGSEGSLVPRDRLDGNRIVASLDTSNIFAFTYRQGYSFAKSSLHGELAWQRGRHRVEAGAGIDLLHTTLEYDLHLNDVGRAYFELLQQFYPSGPGAFPESFDQGKRYYRSHAFVQDRVALWDDRLHVQPGVRFDYYRIIDRAYVSPRLQMAYAIDPVTTVRAAWGRYLQSPGFEKLLNEPQAFDFSEGAGIEELDAEQAYHYVLGLSRWLGDRYRFSIEGYLKKFDDLIVQERAEQVRYEGQYSGVGRLADPRSYRIDSTVALARTARPSNAADGRAHGVEVMLEKRYADADDRVSGWLSYSHARAHRVRPSADDPDGRLRVPFAYDRRHVVNLVVQARLGAKWRLGATFRYGTGFPYTPAVDYAPTVVRPYGPDGRAGGPELLVNDVTGDLRFEVDYGDEENVRSARLPDYHRLDVRLSRQLQIFGLDARAYADVINVYNRRNVLDFHFVAIVDNGIPSLRAQQSLMLPILPTLGFDVRF